MAHKKQLFTLFEDIAKINEIVWNNPKGSYDDATESAYQIEEALEGFDLFDLHNTIRSDYAGEVTPKEYSRLIINSTSLHETGSFGTPTAITDVDRFDKALDAIYFAVGSLHKLGLTPEQMVDGLQIVHNANSMKAGTKDSAGKVTKSPEWSQYTPEKSLQEILDKRTK